MKAKLSIPYNTFLIFSDLSEVGPLFKAIATSTLCEESGYGKTHAVNEVSSDQKISFELVPDDYTVTPNDVIKELREKASANESRWIEYYNKANAAEKALKDLKEKHGIKDDEPVKA